MWKLNKCEDITTYNVSTHNKESHLFHLLSFMVGWITSAAHFREPNFEIKLFLSHCQDLYLHWKPSDLSVELSGSFLTNWNYWNLKASCQKVSCLHAMWLLLVVMRNFLNYFLLEGTIKSFYLRQFCQNFVKLEVLYFDMEACNTYPLHWSNKDTFMSIILGFGGFPKNVSIGLWAKKIENLFIL